MISPHRPPPIDTSCPHPLERVPTEIIPSPVLIPKSPEQPTPEKLLEQYGIKVRDFAYESKLPPVPVVKRLPQTQLRRVREANLYSVGDYFSQALAARQELIAAGVIVTQDHGVPEAQECGSTVPTNYLSLSRAVTCADSTNQNSYAAPNPNCSPSRGLVTRNFDIPPLNSSQVGGLPQLYFQGNGESQLRRQYALEYIEEQSQSPSTTEDSQPPLVSASQADSEMDDDFSQTPLITPNCSMDHLVLDASILPDSQRSDFLVESQAPLGNDISVSQMGLPETQSQSIDNVHRNSSPSEPSHSRKLNNSSPIAASPSPQSSPSSRNSAGPPNRRRSRQLSRTPSNCIYEQDDSALSPPSNRRRNGPSFENEPVRPPASPGRYNLRKQRRDPSEESNRSGNRTVTTSRTSARIRSPSRQREKGKAVSGVICSEKMLSLGHSYDRPLRRSTRERR